VKKARIGDAASWFDVLVTSERTQVAVMLLEPDGESSESGAKHARSDQVLLVLEGSVEAEIGDEQDTLSRGDVVIVPAGTPHRFRCAGGAPALTFNVYGPPAYATRAARERRTASRDDD
jgi:mannose-6-phosphate isomerase-like protein (cupin superfamily)